MYQKATQEQCSWKVYREVSDSVWVSFEAVIIEKTINKRK